MKKLLLALAISITGLSSIVHAEDIELAQFMSEQVNEAITPFKRVKQKASSRIRLAKEKLSMTARNKSAKRSSYNQPNYNTEAFRNTIEPEISPVQSAEPYEADFANNPVAVWRRPSYVSQAEWTQIIQSVRKASKKTGIPEQLILSLINKESGFNPRAVSRSGAIGLTQLMPSTASSECNLSKHDLYNIDMNINCGIGYLEKQMSQFKKLDLAIAAYNAGPGAVRRAVQQTGTENVEVVTNVLKPETKPYVRKILTRINYDSDFI